MITLMFDLLKNFLLFLAALVILLPIFIPLFQKYILKKLNCQELSNHPDYPKKFFFHRLKHTTDFKFHLDLIAITKFMQVEKPEQDKVVIWIGPLFAACIYYGPNSGKEIWFNDKDFPKDFTYKFMKWISGGLVMINGEEHKETRKMMQEAFAPGSLSSYIYDMNKFSDQFVQKLQKLDQKSKKESNLLEKLDIYPLSELLFLDMAAKSTLGKSINALKEPKNDMVSATHTMTDYVIKRFFNPTMFFETTLKIFHKDWFEKEEKGRKLIQKNIRKIVEWQREKIFDDKSTTTDEENSVDLKRDQKPNSLVNILLVGHQNGSISESSMIAQCGTIMFTGTDTTATAFSIIVWLLGLHREWQQRIFNEIGEIFATDSEDNDSTTTKFFISYPNCKQRLPTLNAFITEALRLYPVGPLSTRNCKHNGKIPGLVTNIISYISINRDPRYWDNPNTFDVTRFLDVEKMKNHKRFTNLPFSAGNRGCLGKTYAMQALLVSLSHLLHNFEVFSEVGEEEADFRLTLTLSPVNLFVRLKSRK